MAKKFYVIDTSVFLSDAGCLYKFENNDIIIPTKVLEEIDKQKSNPQQLSVAAEVLTNKLKPIIQEMMRGQNG